MTTAAPVRGQPVLEVRSLTRRFGGLTAVSELDLSIAGGEIFGLIGPNGSGKTTTLHLFTGFLRPTSGEVVYQGQPLHGLAPSTIARRGVVRTFQLTNVFAGYSATDNVRHAQHLHAHDSVLGAILQTPGYRRERRRIARRADELLEFVGFTTRRTNVPAGNLSGGEQRRLEIAIALAAEPQLVLLDEPASGLTGHETEELVRVLRALRERQVTTILVEHNMRMVLGTCDRVAVLNFGAKIADGTPAEISADEGVIAAYLGEKRDAPSR